MDYIKVYRRFVHSYYFADGVRITVGILLPALISAQFGYLQKGIFMALGAMCASITDNPGPIHHRRNGLLLTCGVTSVVSLIVGYALQVPWLFFIILPLFCFLFSMIAVYGARVTSIGIAALLVMVIITHQSLSSRDVLVFASLVLFGGAWYTGFSLLLNSLRPYKLIQQVLGEYVLSASDYLRGRAGFYEKGLSTSDAYQQLMHRQIDFQHKQELLAEILFKTRGMFKESNSRSRVLMMAYLDVSNLMEKAMTSHFDYEKLHSYFDDTEILGEYQRLIEELAAELEGIGIAIISGRASAFDEDIELELQQERERLALLRRQLLKPGNLEGFISLRHILDSISDIASRIRTLHRYTHYDRQMADNFGSTATSDTVISQTDYSWRVFADNLTWNSNVFRHSVRVSVAATVAYIAGLFWNLGHSYWILLTVIVILKPGFALTRTRNVQRLVGTLAGTAIAGLILYFITDNHVVFALLLITMIGAYSFIRWKYQVSVIFITIYLMLMFHLLEPKSFSMIVKDRIIDTFIGSAIALLAARVIPSVWERVQIGALLRQLIEKAQAYYHSVAITFTGAPFDTNLNARYRKETWVALANLSDAFNRMLSEPGNKQVHPQEWHRIVVSAHMVVSHTATLTVYAERITKEFISADYDGIIGSTESCFKDIVQAIPVDDDRKQLEIDDAPEEENALSSRLQAMIARRQQELKDGLMDAAHREHLSTFKTIVDQFYFIRNAAADVRRIARDVTK